MINFVNSYNKIKVSFKIIVFIFLLLLKIHPLSAQFIDSIKASLKQKPKFTFRFDNRNSFISNKSAVINGFKVGVEFAHTLRLGAGYHRLVSDFYKPQIIKSKSAVIDTIESELKLNYISNYIEYVFYKKNRWEFSCPLSIGIGNTRYEYLYNNTEFQRDKKIVVICETGVSGDYKLFSWIGIGMEAGYRLMLINNKAIDENFNSIIYVLKIKLFLSDLCKICKMSF